MYWALVLLASLNLQAAYIEDWARLRIIEPQGYVCGRATGIVIDGKLDEGDWLNAPWTSDFQDIEGSAKSKPRFKTRAKMLWDANFFYIAAELEDPHVWGTLTNHDAVIFQDPDFEVFIDPDGDRHNYYEFEMNALNTGWDLILKKPYIDGGPAQNEWEIPGLKTAVQIKGTLNNPLDKDEGWTLEIAIPWKVLGEYSKQKAPPNDGDIWRVDFSRVQWQINIRDGKYEKVPGKKEDNWVWSPMGIIDMHRPENWGYVKFTNGSAKNQSFTPKRDPKTEALFWVYYAQKDFQKKNGRWAKSLDEIEDSLANVPARLSLQSVRTGLSMRVTRTGYEATYSGKHIREDGLLW